jgi:PAS domain S-box-containing protein
MKTEINTAIEILRQRAENLLKNKPSLSTAELSKEETQKLIHELEIDRLVLEWQVEELRIQAEADKQQKSVESDCSNPNTLSEIEKKEQVAVTLQNSETFLNDIIQTIPDLIWLKDKEGVYLTCNKMFERFIGVVENEIAGKTDYDLVNKELADFFREHDRIAMNAGGPTSNEEWITFADDGHSAFLETVKSPMFDKNGEIVGVLGIGRDITVRKKTEADLREKEVQYNNLANSGLSLIWTSGSDKLCNYFNNPWLRFTGRTLEQEMGNGWAEGVHPEDFDRCLATYVSAFDKQEPFEMEYRLRNAVGEFRWILDMGTPNYNSAGEFIGYIGNCFDITDRKWVEVALKESERKLNSIYNTVGDVIFLLAVEDNKRFRFVSVNPAFGRVTGINGQMVVGQLVNDIIPEPSLSMVLENYEKAIKENSVVRWEELSVYPTGELFGDVCVAPVFDDNGQCTHLVGTVHDITERKHSEEKLRQSEEKFRNFFEHSVVGKSITTIDGKLEVNDAFCQILGYSREELSQLNWKEITYKDDIEFNSRVTGSILKGEKDSEHWEKRYIHKNGNIVWVDISTTLQRDNEGTPLYFITSVNDITDRKQVELKLRESNERLNFILENNPIALWDWNLTEDKLYATPKYYSMIGYESTSEQLDHSAWLKRIHPDDSEFINKRITNTLNHTEEHYSYDARILQADGSYRWQSVIGHVIEYDENGKSSRMLGVRVDIDERKQAELELRESNERLNVILENNPIALWDWNVETDEWYATRKYHTMLGYEAENGNLDRATWLKRVHPDDRESVKLKIAKVLDHTDEQYNYDARMLHADGSYRWQTVIGQVIERDGAGKATRLLGVRMDIDERKRAEEKVRISEEKLNTLFTSMTEMVAIHELIQDERGVVTDYKIIDCNDAFSKTIGIKKEDLIGKPASEVYQTKKAPYLEIYAQVAMTGKSYVHNMYYAPLDKYLLISAVSTGKNQFSTVIADITDIQAYKEALSSKNKELENYLYIASHDLRSPLVNIQGFSQRFQKQSETIKNILTDCHLETQKKESLARITDEDIPKTLYFILSNVAKMDGLINGLLQISRTGRIVMTIKKIDMNQLMRNILSRYNFQITELSAKVKMDDLPGCYGDENQLNQLFSNIIGNALKYTDKSRPFELDITAENHYNKVVYVIKDTGTGIAPRHLEKIWDVFYRVDSASAQAGEGIGLSIVKRIADKHKGKVWAKSEEGKGSTFYIELQKNEFSE